MSTAEDAVEIVEAVRNRMRDAMREVTAASHVSIVDVLMPTWQVKAERNARIMADDTPIYHALCVRYGIWPHDGWEPR
jgi:hypothetical protein